ncbi:hypothetical protein SNEBB_010410 [Seison nebaliae]|nr:hypothetical protein SNEBB_010410 [Seison nebaliae]
MGLGPSKIIDNLFIGDIKDSYSKSFLEKNNIQLIIRLLSGSEKRRSSVHRANKIKLHRISIDDTVDANISQYFEECIKLIHQYRMKNKAVLVHCLVGVSRSATIVIAYLTCISQFRWVDVIKMVKARRVQIRPNPAFLLQLQQFARQNTFEKIRKDLGPINQKDIDQLRLLKQFYDEEEIAVTRQQNDLTTLAKDEQKSNLTKKTRSLTNVSDDAQKTELRGSHSAPF